MKELEKVNITFSRRCNLRCPFCYCERSAFPEDELSLDEWLAFIDELAENKVFKVGICGGEPFFLSELRRIIDRIVQGRMRFHLITNGSCVDYSLLEHIAATGRCNYIQFYIDGLEEVQDAIRGRGVFQKAVAAIRRSRELGIKTTVNTVIARNNRHNALALAGFLETLDLDFYRLNIVNARDLELSPAYHPLSLIEMADMIAEFAPHFDSLPRMHHASPVKRYYQQLREPRSDAGGCDFCWAPGGELAVLPNGVILPCNPAEDVVLGIANRDRIADIKDSALLKAFLKRLARGSARTAARCAGCQYRYYCRKFCPGVSGKRYCYKELAELLRARGVLP